MKITLMILTSNDEDCAQLYVHTGAVVAPRVTVNYREVDLPDVPKGWGIRSVHVQEKPNRAKSKHLLQNAKDGAPMTPSKVAMRVADLLIDLNNEGDNWDREHIAAIIDAHIKPEELAAYLACWTTRELVGPDKAQNSAIRKLMKESYLAAIREFMEKEK